MTRMFVTRFSLLLPTVLAVALLSAFLTAAESLDRAKADPAFGQQTASPTPTPHPVTGGGLPVVSPDGKKIVFGSDRNGSPDLFVIGSDGAGEKQLTHTPETESAAQWSEDGKQVLFSVLKNDTSHIFSIDPDGRNQREMGSLPGRAPMLSPDGKRWLYMAGTWIATKLMTSAIDGAKSVARGE